jgi:hypothetical protein
MNKTQIIEALRATRRKIEKAQKAGKIHLSHEIDKRIVKRNGVSIFKDSPQIFAAQMDTALFNIRRWSHILKQSTEVYVPNLPDIIKDVQRIIPRADESDELYGITFASVDTEVLGRAMMFKERRLPFDETALTFKSINGNTHCILAYPYKKYKHLLPEIEVEESMVVEYLWTGGTPWILPRITYFEYDKVGAGYSDFTNETRIFELAGLGDELNEDLDAYMKYALGALMSLCEILECKNIYLKKHKGVPKKNVLEKDGDEFHTIVVKIGEHVYGYCDKDTCGVTPMDKRYHICRGHFATYTEERKLFGKYVGRYWIPSHARGNIENGSIEKDYVVNV